MQGSWYKGLTQDLLYGLRILKKSPIYTFISVLTLALGIGASTAIFSVVYGILLRPLPYDNPDQIVRVWELDARGRRMRFADPNLEDLRTQARSLQGLAAMRSAEAAVSVNDTAARVRVASVSADFFTVMGVRPVVGRLFASEEQRFGVAPTALVSYSYWQTHLNPTRELTGQKFTVAKNPVTIVGVLPAGFRFPDDSDVWMPRELEVRLPSRTAHNWQAVARLRDGFSIEQTRSDVTAIARGDIATDRR